MEERGRGRERERDDRESGGMRPGRQAADGPGQQQRIDQSVAVRGRALSDGVPRGLDRDLIIVLIN